jgi:hypothetical protein
MDAPQKGIEKRQFGRRQTVLHAVVHPRGRPSIHCIVRDLSIGGARIETNAQAWLPSRFLLIIEALNFEAECQVMHRSNNCVGVRFAIADPVAT